MKNDLILKHCTFRENQLETFGAMRLLLCATLQSPLLGEISLPVLTLPGRVELRGHIGLERHSDGFDAWRFYLPLGNHITRNHRAVLEKGCHSQYLAKNR